MTTGLCQNPDCGAFFEAGQPPVRFWDRYTKTEVQLCQACAAVVPTDRFDRLPESEEPQREERT